MDTLLRRRDVSGRDFLCGRVDGQRRLNLIIGRVMLNSNEGLGIVFSEKGKLRND